MPLLFIERLPLPSLQMYTSVSVLLLTLALYYSNQNLKEPLLDIQAEDGEVNPGFHADVNEESSNMDKILSDNAGLPAVNEHPNDRISNLGNKLTLEDREESTGSSPYMLRLAYSILSEGWCVWILINTSYCCLILLGKGIQKMVFGDLRVSEQQHLKDKLWNFVFYNFIFVFGVMNVQSMIEVVGWCAWFSLLIFFHLLSILCRDRFEYLSFSPTTSTWTHIKVLALLAAILVSCGLLFVVCVAVALNASLHIATFMFAECLLLSLKTIHVVVRYALHLSYLHYDGVWENRSIYAYYSELIFELTALSIDFIHHLHMVLYGNIFLSMASLVICMQLRYLFREFQRRIKRHKNYRRVVTNMEAKFPLAKPEDLTRLGDDCAICWEKMKTARVLPCSHLFHNSCLRSWLEQDTSCPTCRQSLAEEASSHNGNRVAANGPGVMQDNGLGDELPGGNMEPHPATPHNQTTNHFFHFDGSRYVSWLPSFSVEVTHTQILGGGPPQAMLTPAANSQLDNMARQVLELFPSFPLAAIMDDLMITHSAEATIENILEDRLHPRGHQVGLHQQSHSSSNSSTSSTSSIHEPILTTSGSQPTHISTDSTVHTHASGSEIVVEDQIGVEEDADGREEAEPGINSVISASAFADDSIIMSGKTSGSMHKAEDFHQATTLTPTYGMDSDVGLHSLQDSIEPHSLHQHSHTHHAPGKRSLWPSDSRSPVQESSGSRFSKSPAEREVMLTNRKASILAQARRRFLSKQGETSGQTTSTTTTSRRDMNSPLDDHPSTND